jgi:hypothetical protein
MNGVNPDYHTDGRHIDQFPHCDARILHAPGECRFCDDCPMWQELREAWGIAFTGHSDEITGQHPVLPCPADFAPRPATPGDHRLWGGNRPTSASDEDWPEETAASRMMYGGILR